MGNHSTHEKVSEAGSGSNSPRGSTRGTRSGSGEVSSEQGQQEKPEPQTASLVPVEKLGKVRLCYFLECIKHNTFTIL